MIQNCVNNKTPPRPKPYSFPENKIRCKFIRIYICEFDENINDFTMSLRFYKHGDCLYRIIKKLKKTPPPRPEPYSFPENKIRCKFIKFHIFKNDNFTICLRRSCFYLKNFKKTITPPPRPEPYSFPENKIKFLFIWKSIKYIDQLELNMSFEMIK
jgi:hypothetical protein